MFKVLQIILTAVCCKDLFFPQLFNKINVQSDERNFSNPHFVKGHGGIVQLFEWKWKDIARECEDFLSKKSYGGVQVSPPNENVVILNRPWYERYQPMSYLIETRSGNENDFLDMTTRCNAVGVRIYVDAVINHMAADQPNETAIGTAGSRAQPKTRNYPVVPYNVGNFHPACPLVDFNDANQVRNCELVGLHDLNQTVEDTRDKIIEYMNHLISLGVGGFRVDAAKHIWPNDLKIIYNRLKNLNTSFGFNEKSDPFIYQEVVDSGHEAVSKNEYTFASVAEFRYSSEIEASFTGKDDLKWLKSFGESWSLLPSQLAVVFINNHDTQRNDNVLSYKNRRNYIMAQAFSLAHPYGQKRVMSSFAFDRNDQGPPRDRDNNILSPVFDSNNQCTNISGWVCEHRWHEISSMVEFMNIVDGEKVTSWWDNGKNQIAFSRGAKGFIVFNLDSSDIKNVSVPTNLRDGKYCDVISGMKIDEKSCLGKTIEVIYGSVLINLLNDDTFGVIAAHVDQKLQ